MHNKENSLQKKIKRKGKNQNFVLDKKKGEDFFEWRRAGADIITKWQVLEFLEEQGSDPLASPLILCKFLIKYLLLNLYRIIQFYIYIYIYGQNLGTVH